MRITIHKTKQYLTDSNSNKLKTSYVISAYSHLPLSLFFLRERERKRENKTKMQVVSACNNMWCMSMLPTTPQKSISSVLSRREVCISSSLCNHDAIPPQQPISISARYSSFKFKLMLYMFSVSNYLKFCF